MTGRIESHWTATRGVRVVLRSGAVRDFHNDEFERLARMGRVSLRRNVESPEIGTSAVGIRAIPTKLS